jgi:hypothetical protein
MGFHFSERGTRDVSFADATEEVAPLAYAAGTFALPSDFIR